MGKKQRVATVLSALHHLIDNRGDSYCI